MTGKARKDLDALDLLLQGHREVESLFRDFEYLQQNNKNTGCVIDSACAELDLHDALESEVFYAALREAADDEEINGLLDQAEDEHAGIRELIGNLRHTGADQRDACFALLAGRVQQHVLGEETKLFPMVKNMKRLDLDAVTAAMKVRNTEMIADMEITESAEANA